MSQDDGATLWESKISWNTIVSVEINNYIYWLKDSWLDNDIDRKIDVYTAILLVQNRQQTHDWTLIGSRANGLGIQECKYWKRYF